MKRPSILIVDDDEEILKSRSIALENEYPVFKASDGKDGLGILSISKLAISY